MHQTENDAIELAREKYVTMARAREAAGREIPARPLSVSQLGDFAKEQVEVSQELLRVSRRRTFSLSLADVLEAAAARREAREARERARGEASNGVEEDCG